MDCTRLAEVLSEARGRQEVFRRALTALEEAGVIRCGEAYWVGESLSLLQMQACRANCSLAPWSRALAEEALRQGTRVERDGFVALPLRQGSRTLAVLVLKLELGQKIPEALPALLLLALRRPGLELSGRLLWAQEEERRRVGRELHDGVGSLLTAALLTLKVAERRPEQLAEARRRVAEALEEVRRLSRELRMPLLDDLGLKEALKRYLEEYRKGGVEVEAHLEIPPLPKEKEVALFRVVQEALTNTLRHAQAQRVQVRLWREGDRLFGVVADDGVGFDPEKTPASVGMLGMQERIQGLGGSLLVHSVPGQGTRVEFGVPL
ncbi:sensor histidine kinase [Thermus thermamylovorans]|uniref:histidine kinase n=1 Tax=Thermus thermamylovorans TaxID=2509362 RepID=A0A4Q9B6U3_9DEIN|nr:sensor histidine kinase [Thermus thermamylovorans]TBH21424.1 sensor histidine kinase [Thermus thermamylovorans]